MAIYSLSDIKTKLLNITGTGKDAALTEILSLATGYLQTICRQPIEQATVTHYAEGSKGTILELPFTVPVTISAYYTRQLPTDSWTAAPVTPTVFERENGRQGLYLANGFSEPYHKLTLSVGYASGYPEAVKLVYAEMVKELYLYSGFAAEADRFGIESSSQSVGGFTTTTKYKSLESRWRSLLSPYTLFS